MSYVPKSVPAWRANAPAGVTLSQIRPKATPPPQPRRSSSNSGQMQAGGGGGYYEALRTSSDRTPMVPAAVNVGSRPYSWGGERVRISALSRALYDNGGFVGLAVNQIAFYSVPIIPQADSKDSAWNNQAEAWFGDWSRRADFYGRSCVDFWSLQTLICQALDLDGDMGALATEDSGFPQIQLVEGWKIGAISAQAEPGLIDGVRLDGKGRVVGYEIDSNGKPIPVPAANMMLVRDPCITNPLRGVSPLRRGMNDIRDLRDILGFEKLGVKHNSSLLGVLEGGFLDEEHGFNLGDSDEKPSEVGESTEEDPHTDGEQSLSRADMLGGDIPALPDGKKFKRVESNRPNAGFTDFLDSLAAQFVAGLDIPPAFFLDSKRTGPNQRAVNGKAQRKFDQRQDVMVQFVEWVWVRVIGWAIQNGELAAPDGWWRIKAQRPARITIDAGRESREEREDVGRALMTRQEHYGNRSRDWLRETTQSFTEDETIIAEAKRLAAKTGVSLEIILSRYGFGPPPAQQSQQAAQSNDGKSNDE